MDVEVVSTGRLPGRIFTRNSNKFPEARTYTYGMELIERENLDAEYISAFQATCIQSMP